MKISSQAARGFEASLIHQLRIRQNLSRAELARSMETAPSTIGHPSTGPSVEASVVDPESPASSDSASRPDELATTGLSERMARATPITATMASSWYGVTC